MKIISKLKQLRQSLFGDGLLVLRKPKTMAGLVATGSLMAATPLVLAVILAGVVLGRLTDHTEALIEKGVTVTSLGTQLRDTLNDLERNAQQYIALRDPALLDVFRNRLDETEVAVRRIDAHDRQGKFAPQAQRIRQGLKELADISTQIDGQPPTLAIERIQKMQSDADEITHSGRESVAIESDRLREAATVARHVLLWSSLALAPLTALLAWAISIVVTRPLQHMGRSIVALGHARYDRPIQIDSPVEMQRLGEHLDWLRRRLSQFETDRDRFLRNVSHDLKTPLASMKEGSSLLRDGSLGPLTANQKEVAIILSRAADDLESQISKLLAYAAWREEHKKNNMAWFDIWLLLAEVLATHKLPMAQHELSTEFDVRVSRLFGQRAQVKSALDNLIANAIKHAPHGTSITLHVGVENNRCELSVRDRGAGVPAADRKKIFEPFVRGSKRNESGVAGTGVGLSIVRETALAHSGTAEVEDAQPGARFKMVWPCAQLEA